MLLFNKVKNRNARKLTITKNPKKKINPKFYPLNKVIKIIQYNNHRILKAIPV